MYINVCERNFVCLSPPKTPKSCGLSLCIFQATSLCFSCCLAPSVSLPSSLSRRCRVWGVGSSCTSFLIHFFPCLCVSVWCLSKHLLVWRVLGQGTGVYTWAYLCRSVCVFVDFFLSLFNPGKNIYITKFAVLPIVNVQLGGTLHPHCCTTTCGRFLCVSVVLRVCVCAHLGRVVSVCLSVFECEGLCFCLRGSVHRRVFHWTCPCLSCMCIGCVRICLCLSLTVWVYVWGSCVPMRGLLQCVSMSLCLCARIHVRLSLCLMLGPCQPMSALVLSMSLCVYPVGVCVCMCA